MMNWSPKQKKKKEKNTANKKIVVHKELQCSMTSFLYTYTSGSVATIL